MLLKWKRVTALEYVAQWQDEAFQLTWSPVEHRWQAFINGLRVKDRWHAIPAAMDSCETALNRYIAKLSATVTARQRELSPKVILRTDIGHIGSKRSNFTPTKGVQGARVQSL
jgi:hypothetical protein